MKGMCSSFNRTVDICSVRIRDQAIYLSLGRIEIVYPLAINWITEVAVDIILDVLHDRFAVKKNPSLRIIVSGNSGRSDLGMSRVEIAYRSEKI